MANKPLHIGTFVKNQSNGQEMLPKTKETAKISAINNEPSIQTPAHRKALQEMLPIKNSTKNANLNYIIIVPCYSFNYI